MGKRRYIEAHMLEIIFVIHTTCTHLTQERIFKDIRVFTEQ